jgi:hypothetical protein
MWHVLASFVRIGFSCDLAPQLIRWRIAEPGMRPGDIERLCAGPDDVERKALLENHWIKQDRGNWRWADRSTKGLIGHGLRWSLTFLDSWIGRYWFQQGSGSPSLV